jgi:hypothetical protein
MPECRDVVPALRPLGAESAVPAAGAARAPSVACWLHHDVTGRPRARPAAERAG